MLSIGTTPQVYCFTHVSSRKASSKARAMNVTEPSSNKYSAISIKVPSSHHQIIPITRRSGNYKPTMWDFEFIQSAHNDYVGEKYKKRFNELKKETKKLIVEGSEEVDQLEVVDNLERLGVSYHFNDEIMHILTRIHARGHDQYSSSSLYSTALKFRLLRQHGFHISQDIFNNFMDENGDLKQSICGDTKGLLQLYEASFLSTEIETTLKKATSFTETHLKKYVTDNQHSCGEDNNVMVALVRHALELPRHWMMLRIETEWYISIYERMPYANPLLLELSMLDFNMVQAAHQQELRNLSRWWKSTRLAEKLSFSRDRLVEAFFWTVGILFEPHHDYCRRTLTKVVAFIVAIDDIYDIYGTLHELEIFTDAVERWDTKAMEQLPNYMKICYLALFNTTNEMAYDILKEQGINVLPYLTKSWADLCKAYLREATWYYTGYMPTLQEYMDNAWISIGTPLILVHVFFFVTNHSITEEALESATKYPDFVRRCSTINRFVDDLGTSLDELKRGDAPKSIQCYMNDKGVSEEEARENIRLIIKATWGLMNKDLHREDLLFCRTFKGIALNFSRTSHCMYQHGDGHGIQNSKITNRISKVLFEPIRIPKIGSWEDELEQSAISEFHDQVQ